MPFTVSHAAVAVALPAPLRRLVVPSAVVAGAMSPDFVYYVGPLGWVVSGFTHSLVGAVTVDAAMAIMAVALWRWVMRMPVLSLLPQPWRGEALAQTADFHRGRPWPALAAAVYLSSAAGALSHVLIDLLTHESAATPDVLAGQTVDGVPLTWLLQLGLSVVGLVALAWWLARWWRSVPHPVGQAVQWPRSSLVVAGATAAAGMAVALARALRFEDEGVRTVLVQMTFGAVLGATAVLLLWCVGWRVVSPRSG